MHPSFGSLIDGGIDDLGTEQPSMIGSHDWERTALRVEGEIRRICADYQRQQLARARADRYAYGKSTLSNDELLLQINDISFQQAQDQLMVTVHITTGNNQTQRIDLPLDATGSLF